MNAVLLFYETIGNRWLPASVPIKPADSVQDEFGYGIATASFDPEWGPAKEMCFSQDPWTRARAAVYACQQLREDIIERHPEVEPLEP